MRCSTCLYYQPRNVPTYISNQYQTKQARKKGLAKIREREREREGGRERDAGAANSYTHLTRRALGPSRKGRMRF